MVGRRGAGGPGHPSGRSPAAAPAPRGSPFNGPSLFYYHLSFKTLKKKKNPFTGDVWVILVHVERKSLRRGKPDFFLKARLVFSRFLTFPF